ncbi:MAG: cytochrome c oxidase subunit II, partial [Actinobacteria bacterium]
MVRRARETARRGGTPAVVRDPASTRHLLPHPHAHRGGRLRLWGAHPGGRAAAGPGASSGHPGGGVPVAVDLLLPQRRLLRHGQDARQTGEPIHIELESRDVIHSFFVPAFLFKRDVIPGRHNNFTFTATQLGTFQAQCAEFCGLYHSKMTFSVRVVNPADYLAWVKSTKEAALNVSCPSQGNSIKVTAKDTNWDTACISVNQ